MIEVVNRQRKVRVDLERWQTFSERALAVIQKPTPDATIAFVSDQRIRDLNRQFRGIDTATDVLSFPAGEDSSTNLGDIAISVERAEVQAKENDLSSDQEIAQLILHGLLHLCGYDHETDDGEMNRFELRLRKKLQI